MKATVVLAHPYKESFNHAIYNRVIETLDLCGITVFYHDLYSDGFNPVLSVSELGKEPSNDLLVKKYVEDMVASEFLIFIHPNWWGMPPAILKGYIDRVIRPPHAYDFPTNDSGGGLPIGKLKGK
ncbi:MAG: NAD(P)H-dependent oxidoreductase, partial [Candidatus Brocadiaceae bacterium]|nr:NAD(P)H-dependent oxidoreductase [Candidatus Brocadiaceae bacterium]